MGMEFFEKLEGEWELTGEMSQIPLQQAVTAKWMLDRLFLEVRCRSTLPPPEGQKPYEALYLIGYNQAEDLYVMNLFDTFGVATKPIPGLGRREGDSVVFVFDYAGVPWTNRWTYHPQRDTWTNDISYRKDGETRTFAVKRLSRSIASAS